MEVGGRNVKQESLSLSQKSSLSAVIDTLWPPKLYTKNSIEITDPSMANTQEVNDINLYP
jgi:hypothetical protein